MKVTVYGAGAIGGHLGAHLSRQGADVSLIARDEHLEAMRVHGLKQITKDEEVITPPNVTDAPSTLGPQDYVVMSLKSYQAPGVVEALQPLLGPDTVVATAMNGIPWWYFYKLPGPWENYRVKAVDPDDKQWDGIGPEQLGLDRLESRFAKWALRGQITDAQKGQLVAEIENIENLTKSLTKPLWDCLTF